jgi:hypothetical protein
MTPPSLTLGTVGVTVLPGMTDSARQLLRETRALAINASQDYFIGHN